MRNGTNDTFLLLTLAALAASLPAQTEWLRLQPANQPSPRYAGCAYDTARNMAVLFGGRAELGLFLAETFEWDGLSWRARSVAQAPTPRADMAMAYDPIRRKTYLFGGRDDGPAPLGDTWAYDGQTWTQVATPVAPAPRSGAGMAFDAARGEIVLFAGVALGYFSDTWTFDGTTWTQRQPANSPPERATASLAYDHARRQVVLFGGLSEIRNGNQVTVFDRDDTWAWDGTNWREHRVSPRPLARSTAAMVDDEARDRIVLFGNSFVSVGAPADTWEWDGSAWLQRTPRQPPAEVTAPAMFYDPRHEAVFAYLTGYVGGSLQSETWRYASLFPARLAGFGSGCAASAPVLSGEGRPFAGSTQRVQVTGLAASSGPVALAIGTSNLSWAGQSLPLRLDAIGMTGCALLVSVDGLLASSSAAARVQWSLPLPAQAAVYGARVHLQSAAFDPAANAAGVAWSNGLTLQIGAR